MGLRKDQSMFVRRIVRLICYAHSLGYELTFADAYAKMGHRKGSFHYKRLAIDLNLFIDGVYQRSTKAHRPLGEYWEVIGGTWGGRFKDGNHYSWKEKRKGVRK